MTVRNGKRLLTLHSTGYLFLASYCAISSLANTTGMFNVSLQWPQLDHNGYVIIGSTVTNHCEYPEYAANRITYDCVGMTADGPGLGWNVTSGDVNIPAHCLGEYVHKGALILRPCGVVALCYI